MKPNTLKFIAIAAAALIVAAAVLILAGSGPEFELTLSNAETGQVYGSFPVDEGDVFSVEFIHSVNQSPVIDHYEIREGGDIYVTETHYFAFGAGVQTELNPGEYLEYGEDGSMQVKNINKHIPSLIYVVGTVSDHVMKIDGQEISLRELCGRNNKVLFTTR